MNTKLDLTKQFKQAFTAGKKPEIVELPETNYLSIAGVGDPAGEAFSGNIQALYSTAYAIKFFCKADGNDFVVPKLEALWSFDMARYGHITMAEAPLMIPRSEWNYRLLLRMPEFVNKELAVKTAQTVATSKNIPQAIHIEWFTLHEGKCVQLLHTGPFSTEPESLAILATFMDENQFVHNGLHHEVYLSDFRKTTPEKLRTILREPVKSSENG